MRLRTARSAMVGTAAVLCVASAGDVQAALVWPSACLGDATEKTTFNAGDQVCASGDVDYVPPGEICGAGDLYVIPKDHPNPFVDVTLGGANYFTTCLGAGAFLDQSMWLPPLKPGQYEIVLDQTPFFGSDNAPFDSSRDIRGVYFTVSNAPIVFSCDPAAIKLAAAQSAAEAALIGQMVELIKAIQLLEGLLSAETPAALAYKLFCEALSQAQSPVSCPQAPWDWTQGKALELLDNLGKALVHMYTDIANDPPDANFLEVVPFTMTDPLLAAKPWPSPVNDELSNRTAFTAQLMATQTSAYRAFLPSFEKEQGAQVAGDHVGHLLQTEKMIAYLDLAKASGDAIGSEIDAIVALADQEPSGDGAVWQALIEGVAANGFTEEEEAFLRSFGAGDAEIAEAAQLLSEFGDGLSLPSTVGYASLGKALKDSHQSMLAAVNDLRAQAEAVRAENEPYALRLGPKAAINTPGAGMVGSPLSLTATAAHFDATATLSYAWDTDLDGAFDDGTGATTSFVPVAGGRQLVSVQVTDDAGHADVAFALVDAVTSNSPPRITALSPAEVAPFADVGQEMAFHVDAEDEDGDPLSITWSIDGVEAGMGADLSWTMPDEEAHTVEVVIADDDAFSPDASAGLVVRASKWQGATGEGAGGGGASGGAGGAASGAGGSGAANGADATDSGCGCVVVGGTDEDAAWLLALALGAVALARRRRRREHA